MATFLFDDFEDFKSYAGGTVNQSVTLESLRPALEEAANSHIIPWLSQDQWDELETAVEASPTPVQTDLLDKLKRAYALLTMYEHTATSGIQVSDAGILRVETEEMKSAYKYQENKYRDWNLHTGYNRLEGMIKFMNNNSDDYPTWSATDEAARSTSLFINYTSELQLLLSQKLSRYTFEILRPIMAEVEELAILAVLGDDFYEELKTAVAAGPTTAEKKVIAFIQKAVAHFTIHQALYRNLVRIDGEQIVKQESLEPQSFKKKGTANSAEIDAKAHYESTTGNRYISRLLDYLKNNLDDYPTYKTYYDALQEEAEEENSETERSCSTGSGYGCTTQTKTSKIVRL